MITKPLRILLIDDNPGDRRLVEELMKYYPHQSYTFVHLDSIKAVLETEGVFDAILLDLKLTDSDGKMTFQQVNAHFPTTPIIVMTGLNDEEMATELVKNGAQDYLVKGQFDANMLARAIRYSIERKSSQNDMIIQKGKNQALRRKTVLLAEEGRRLSQLNKLKDEFISLASHQLRTPATGVKQYLGMIIEGYVGSLSETQLKMARKAYESNERQIQIINDILRVARLDAGEVKVRKSQVDIVNLLDDVIKEQAWKFKERQQILETNLPDNRVLLSIDGDLIRMVLENIIDNASKYSPDHSYIKVAVEVGNPCVNVVVSDTGVGIAEDDMSHLFKKFSRVQNSRSTQENGTGLGLYWAKEIISLHKGDIDVESTPDVGTTFRVSLPHKYK